MHANTLRRSANSGETATAGAPSCVRGRANALSFKIFNLIAHLLLEPTRARHSDSSSQNLCIGLFAELPQVTQVSKFAGEYSTAECVTELHWPCGHGRNRTCNLRDTLTALYPLKYPHSAP